MIWLQTIKKSYTELLRSHPRSNAKLKPLHQWIREWLENALGKNYEVYSLHTNNELSKEKKVQGAFYKKSVDVCIIKENKVVGVAFFKFINSNYAQNSNNYFESMVGETTNIKEIGIPVIHILVFRENIPYFNKERVVTKYEIIGDRQLDKYFKLLECDISGSPNELSITIVKIRGDRFNGDVIHSYDFKQKLTISEQQRIISSLNINSSELNQFGREIRDKLENISIEKSLHRFVNDYIKTKSN